MKKSLFLSFCFLLLAASALHSRSKNPFKEGTGKIELSVEEKKSLLEYASDSRIQLEKALKDAAGKPLLEINNTYLKTIKKVVIASFSQDKRSELLMRIVLNQALEITYGVPTPDGLGVQEPGTLKKISNFDLLTAILEESILLALQYYPHDKKAIEAGSLVKLPYNSFAGTRLALAIGWLTAVHEWDFMEQMEKAILQQWLNTVASADSMEKMSLADRILEVNDALEKVENNSYPLPQKVRYLRGIIIRTLDGYPGVMENPVHDSATSTSSEPVTNAVATHMAAKMHLIVDACSDKGNYYESNCLDGFFSQDPIISKIVKQCTSLEYVIDEKKCLNALLGNHNVQFTDFSAPCDDLETYNGENACYAKLYKNFPDAEIQKIRKLCLELPTEKRITKCFRETAPTAKAIILRMKLVMTGGSSPTTSSSPKKKTSNRFEFERDERK